jgi:hypothetical protein
MVSKISDDNGPACGAPNFLRALNTPVSATLERLPHSVQTVAGWGVGAVDFVAGTINSTVNSFYGRPLNALASLASLPPAVTLLPEHPLAEVLQPPPTVAAAASQTQNQLDLAAMLIGVTAAVNAGLAARAALRAETVRQGKLFDQRTVESFFPESLAAELQGLQGLKLNPAEEQGFLHAMDAVLASMKLGGSADAAKLVQDWASLRSTVLSKGSIEHLSGVRLSTLVGQMYFDFFTKASRSGAELESVGQAMMKAVHSVPGLSLKLGKFMGSLVAAAVFLAAIQQPIASLINRFTAPVSSNFGRIGAYIGGPAAVPWTRWLNGLGNWVTGFDPKQAAANVEKASSTAKLDLQDLEKSLDSVGMTAADVTAQASRTIDGGFGVMQKWIETIADNAKDAAHVVLDFQMTNPAEISARAATHRAVTLGLQSQIDDRIKAYSSPPRSVKKDVFEQLSRAVLDLPSNAADVKAARKAMLAAGLTHQERDELVDLLQEMNVNFDAMAADLVEMIMARAVFPGVHDSLLPAEKTTFDVFQKSLGFDYYGKRLAPRIRAIFAGLKVQVDQGQKTALNRLRQDEPVEPESTQWF